MANTLANIGSETLRRLSREGRLAEAGQALREQYPAVLKEPDFADAFRVAFISNLVRAAEADLHSVAESVALAWQLVEAHQLFPEEPYLGRLKRLVLPAVDWARGQAAAATLAERTQDLPFAQEYRAREAVRKASRGSRADASAGPVIRLERRIAVTEYRSGRWEASSASACSARRTLLRSPQEREFLKAARMFFVGREVLPNIRLANFVEMDALKGLPAEIRRYGLLAEADVLIATPVDFDPLGVIELDSAYHDTPIARLRDAMKERLLEMAGIPFVRLRAEPIEAIHADNFYRLLQDQWQKFEAFRAPNWRERDMHARMLPAA